MDPTAVSSAASSSRKELMIALSEPSATASTTTLGCKGAAVVASRASHVAGPHVDSEASTGCGTRELTTTSAATDCGRLHSLGRDGASTRTRLSSSTGAWPFAAEPPASASGGESHPAAASPPCVTGVERARVECTDALLICATREATRPGCSMELRELTVCIARCGSSKLPMIRGCHSRNDFKKPGGTVYMLG